MATEVATLVARLEADVRDFETGLRRAERRLDGLDGATTRTRKQQGRLNKQIGMTGLTLKTVFAGAAGAATLKFMKDSVVAASNMEESVNAVEKTYGDAADAVLALGENSAKSVGLAEADFNQMAVSFGAFTEAIASGGQHQSVVLDDLTTRIADFASVMNLDVAEAAATFRSGLAGESEPLRRFGIDVSAAAVNLRAMEMGLAGSTQELTEQDKILARYNLIMEQTAKTAGDFADTSDSFANQQRIVNAQLTDLQATIGSLLLPALAELLGAGGDLLTLMDGLLTPIQALTGADGLGGLGEAAFRLIPGLSGITDALGFLGGLFEESEAKSNAFQLQLESQHRQEILSMHSQEALAGSTEKVGEATETARHRFEQGTGQVGKWAEENSRAAAEVGNNASAIANLNTQIENFINPMIGAIRASVDYKEALDANAEALRKYGEGSNEARDAGLNLLESYANLVGKAEVLAQKQGTNVVQALMAVGREAGLTDSQIDTLIRTYGEVPEQVGTTVTADTGDADAGLRGVHRAIDTLDGRRAFTAAAVDTSGAAGIWGVINAHNQLSGRRTSSSHTVTTHKRTVFSSGLIRQFGGPVPANTPALVGEAGPEVVTFDRPANITSNSDAAAFGGFPDRGGGGEIHFHNHGVIGSEAELEKWVRTVLRKTARRNGRG